MNTIILTSLVILSIAFIYGICLTVKYLTEDKSYFKHIKNI